MSPALFLLLIPFLSSPLPFSFSFLSLPTLPFTPTPLISNAGLELWLKGSTQPNK
ncbi:hypothetical protein ACRRTK_008073 [Alexandromys fortis]